MSTNGRDQILAAIRDALGDAAGDDQRRQPEPGSHGDERPIPADQPIPRDYNPTAAAGLDDFISRLHHYDAQTHVVSAGDVAGTIRSICALFDLRRIVTPAGIPDHWVAGLDPLIDDPPLSAAELDGADGLVSTCAVAIAQTGTIVLDGGLGMGRRALSLVPDHHLCVVAEEQIVGSVPEAIAALEPTRPLTFISGPSATVDIELVRIGGVHGPRHLDVIIVRAPS